MLTRLETAILYAAFAAMIFHLKGVGEFRHLPKNIEEQR